MPVIIGLALVTSPAWAERFRMEGAIINSLDAKPVGTTRGEGEINQFFVEQKKMVRDILDGLGVDFNSLPKDIQDSISRFHTRNFQAFLAFAEGLNALDEGRYAEAKAFFQKARELDENFQLAGELEVAMPKTSIQSSIQLQAVLQAAAQNAVESGQSYAVVDAEHAAAALASGQTIVALPGGADAADRLNTGTDFTSNPPGSEERFADKIAAGLTYTPDNTIPAQISFTGEWPASQVTQGTDGQLASLGEPGELLASRGNASTSLSGSHVLGDNSAVYWGTWNSSPGALAEVTVNGVRIDPAKLGSEFHYMVGQATRQLPTVGTDVKFNPTATGGFLGNPSGSISVNFVDHQVKLNNLGFTLGAYQFSQLSSDWTGIATAGSGFFKGNYASGTCVGCTAFSPSASSFTGNFLGAGAEGLILSNIMQTGSGTVGGVHLFTK